MPRRNKRTKDPGAYCTIAEVSDEIGIPAHVLRFWETRFGRFVRPERGRFSQRRRYSPQQRELLKEIKQLLRVERYQIAGAVRVLEQRAEAEKAAKAPATAKNSQNASNVVH